MTNPPAVLLTLSLSVLTKLTVAAIWVLLFDISAVLATPLIVAVFVG